MVAPTAGGPDRETSQYMAIGAELSSARAGLTALQSRLTSGSTDLSNDPSDPDLQILSGLKEKLSICRSRIVGRQGRPWPQQSEDGGPTGEYRDGSQADWRRDRENAPASERAHRLGANPDRVARGQSKTQAQKSLIDIQAQRDRLGAIAARRRAFVLNS